jgi:hypothetical protein
MGAGAGPRFDVHVDDALLAEDLAHSSVSARSAITTTIDSVRRDGVPREWLRRCEGEARDGTRLAGCVKFYIPRPAGQWGAVLLGDQRDGQPVLVLLAVGERHPRQPWRPSVYEVAHRRLHG